MELMEERSMLEYGAKLQVDAPAGGFDGMLASALPTGVPGKELVYGVLVAHGAPLAAWGPCENLGLEEALALGLGLAHEDATLLRTLPVVFARNAARLNWKLLQQRAQALGYEAELGLLLELTSRLTGHQHLAALAKGLEHARPTQPRHFFKPRGMFDRMRTEQGTPEVARRWGFLMNMPEDGFRTLLLKHNAQVQR